VGTGREDAAEDELPSANTKPGKIKAINKKTQRISSYFSRLMRSCGLITSVNLMP
jgi:hypothetical protein